MPRIDIRKALIIGSGAIKIAEAAEFDYSGSQALKALREEGVETVLLSPNVATIQTSYKLADHVYLGPLRRWFVEKVIERERPDGILLGFGGQTALSLGVELYRSGILKKYGVEVLGTPIKGIEAALSRGKFSALMKSNRLPVLPSLPVRGIEEALGAAEKVGYPVMVRVSFNLGGSGSFVAWSNKELREKIINAFASSGSGEVLVERYLHHWKEVEFEVIRDYYGNAVAVACLENADPMGVHTGDSVVIAPCQTLLDQEYQMLRRASIEVAEAIGLIGESNVQLALNPRNSWEHYIIETNPRMSRSSALASKATGYPLAYIATKLALGYRLNELINSVTGKTCACFEPSLDYVVVKVPRWDLEKFDGVATHIGSEMKSIGEVMAIGRNFTEAMQKAIRMLDIGEQGLTGGQTYEAQEQLGEVMQKLRERKPYWPLLVAKALRLGATIDNIYNITGVDKYYLQQIADVVKISEKLRKVKLNCVKDAHLLAEAKRLGFSDEQIASLIGASVEGVKRLRRALVERPYVKLVDTLAAEWPSRTKYLYTTYNGFEDDGEALKGEGKKIVVVGAGVFRIGASVEFDWAMVNFTKEAKKLGYEVILINYNPETVSTDWDVNDKLYFEEPTLERILDIYEVEKPIGIVTFLGGQISNRLAKILEENNATLLGTSGKSVDIAENRATFSRLLEELGLKQPEWAEATSIKEALRFAESVGYPIIARPSYVLSGSAMKVAWSPEDLMEYVTMATKISPRHPVVVSKFIENAVEAEVDAAGDGSKAVGAIIEHIEPAGVHSGDSTMVLPWYSLPQGAVDEMVTATRLLNETLKIRGPYNIQFLIDNAGKAYIIELNLRASRSMPFTSKVTGYNIMRAAAEASLKGSISYGFNGDSFKLIRPRWWGVKSPQFSWQRLRGAYPGLGPEMRSTGEAAALGDTIWEALLKSWLSVQNNRLPDNDKALLIYSPTGRGVKALGNAAMLFEKLNYQVYTIKGMEVDGFESINPQQAVKMEKRGVIGLVATTSYAPQKDHSIRRVAADLGVPLILNHQLAYMLAKGLLKVRHEQLKPLELRDYWSRKVVDFQTDKPLNHNESYL